MDGVHQTTFLQSLAAAPADHCAGGHLRENRLDAVRCRLKVMPFHISFLQIFNQGFRLSGECRFFR